MSANKVSDVQNQSDVAIILDNVVKKFPAAMAPALAQVSARIKKGCITGLVGPDGAGKTTLIRIIAGLLTVNEGQVTAGGLDPNKDLDRLRAILGYMPQKFGLYEDLTVMENLVLYADLRNVPIAEREAVFNQLLDFTDLKRFTSRPAGKLSGGMKQKLGLACALLGNPEILLLDEPSVGVDPIARRELWKMVNVLLKKGITVVWSTSYLDEAELCDEVLLMHAGKILYSGKPDALTATIKGRSMQVRQIEGNHRLVLQRALRLNEVMDGVIQGNNVRLLLRKSNQPPKLSLLEAGSKAELVQVPPRFEDAFIDLLGGGPDGDSKLAKVMHLVEKSSLENVIEAVELTKQFDTFVATDHINFSVKRGEVFGLLGPNGAGKSTTFKMMCGLLTPTSGTAHVQGIDLQKSPSEAHQQVGYMAQKFSLYGDLTVMQNLQFYAGIYGITGKEKNQKIAEMIEIFDLAADVNTNANELSLGYKQRLSLVCAIMHEPSILFLDEPTSGVDPITRREFWTHINGLVQKGVTIMVTTHFMDEAEYCDRIGLIYRGKLIAAGTPDQLKDQASNAKHPEPTMEEAFIELIIQHDKENEQNTFASDQPKIDFLAAPSSRLDNFISRRGTLRRSLALCRKEFYQIVRDPSNVLIAFVLPIIMLFIYGYGINLDSTQLRMGIVLEDTSSDARRFGEAFFGSPYLQMTALPTAAAATKQLLAGKIRGFVTIQTDFSKQLNSGHGIAPVQLITDGSETNTANFVSAYATGAQQIWQQLRLVETGQPIAPNINIEPRYWFNPSAISRNFIVPGSIAIIMTVIGALLTSLVVAREWERGTMEALLSTSITRLEFLFSKWVPYYLLGIASMAVCWLIAITLLHTPFRGSLFFLFTETSLFLGSALGLGLWLSTATRNQFNAAQASLNLAFLPAIMLSGFIFEISSMPAIVRAVTYLMPPRYFVSSLQTLFLAGNVGGLLFKNGLFLLIFAVLLLGLTAKLTRRRLD
jgi:ABC-type multidrug transport system ATPase subunit/ABC-type multidrug transport system permease subunit